MKRVVVFLTVVGVVGAAALLGADSYRAKLLDQTVNVQADTSYTVERGANLRGVLDNFASDGWIEEPLWTYRALRFEGRGDLRTGTYRIEQGTTLLALIDAIEKGRVVTETLTIVEGSNRWQIREQLSGKNG